MTTNDRAALAAELTHALAWADSEARDLAACQFPKKEAKARRALAAIKGALTALATTELSAADAPLTPDMREQLRQAVMVEIVRRMPRISQRFHEWRDWPGVWA